MSLVLVLFLSVVDNVGATGSGFTLDTDIWVTDGSVSTILPDGEGSVYIGGSFTHIGPYTGNGVQLDTFLGEREVTFPKVNGIINVAISDESGRWYIGGDFTQVGGVTRNRIARVGIDGVVDSAFNPNANGEVLTLALSGADLYVGGVFTAIGGTNQIRLVKLDATTGVVDETFVYGGYNAVRTLALSDTNIYVGGSSGVQKLDISTGVVDYAFSPNADNGVYTLALSGTDLYAGGSFISIGGLNRHYLAKLNTTNGTVDTNFSPDPNGYGIYSSVISDDDFYVGGAFSIIGGEERSCLAKIDTITGTADPLFNSDVNGNVTTLTISGTDLYAGGEFTSVGGLGRNHLAKIDATNGSVDMNFNPNMNGLVSTIALSGTDLYAGGDFLSTGGDFSYPHFARWTVSLATHTLTYNTAPNAIIFGSYSQTVTEGSAGTAVEAIPDDGYRFVRWSDGVTANPRTDTNVTEDIAVSPIIEENTSGGSSGTSASSQVVRASQFGNEEQANLIAERFLNNPTTTSTPYTLEETLELVKAIPGNLPTFDPIKDRETINELIKVLLKLAETLTKLLLNISTTAVTE